MPRNDELLFLETDGACAYCGHKDTRALTIHHMIQAVPKIEDYDNKIVLCHNCHQCHHQGKGPTSDELEEIKRRLIIKTLTPLGVSALKYAFRRSRVSAAPFLVNHLIEYGYLMEKEMMSDWSEDASAPSVVITALYAITAEGRTLLEKWGLK
jgi:hypothetical protein